MVVLGIDPGATGAIAIYDPVEETLDVIDMPVVKVKRGRRVVKEVDAASLANALADLIDHPRRRVSVYLERVGAMPGQGVSSMFAFGRAVGVLEGVLAGMEIPVTFVAPNVWTRVMQVQGGKDGSRKRAGQLFPSKSAFFRRVEDHGRADAVLIAAYGARQLGADLL